MTNVAPNLAIGPNETSNINNSPGTQFQPAGFWLRFVASLIDGVIVGIVENILIYGLTFGFALAFRTNPHAGAYGSLIGLVLFFVFASVQEYGQCFKASYRAWFLRFVFAGFMLYGVVSAYQTIYQHRVVPSQREWRLFFNTIAQSNLNQYGRIYVIEPQEEHLRHRGDEYRNLTTRYSHNMLGLLSCALREMTKGQMTMFHLAYDDAGKRALFVFENPKNKGVFIPYVIGLESGPAPAHVPEGTLVIDMRVLHDF